MFRQQAKGRAVRLLRAGLPLYLIAGDQIGEYRIAAAADDEGDVLRTYQDLDVDGPKMS